MQSDIDEFEKYRDSLDDQLRKGGLEAGYTIFNRFQSRLESRLEGMLAMDDKDLDNLDFEGEDVVQVSREDAAWAKDMAALDDIWLRQFKNAVLSMRLNEAEDEDIKTRLTRRYESQLKRIRHNTPEDVFHV